MRTGRTSRASAISRSTARSLMVMVCTIGIAACLDREGDAVDPIDPAVSGSRHQSLLTAYALLEETLEQEASLDALALLKKVTFQSPVPELEDLMGRLDESSEARLEELEALRARAPDVSTAPDYTDPIGEAITRTATELGTDEMLEWGGLFGTRFILLQAQATRMISAISRAAADLEQNDERRAWLLDMAAEYEAFRNELVEIIRLYVAQEGAAQLDED